MKAVKIILKVICVPFMLIIKAVVGIVGLVILLFTLTAYMGTGLIGYLLSIISGLASAVMVFGIGLMIYKGQYDQILGYSLAVAIFSVIAVLPFMAEALLEKLGELGGMIISLAVSDIPIIINI